MSADRVIRKHVAIIHAYSLMSLLQRKIFNVLLYEANRNEFRLHHPDSVAVECRIPLSALSKAVRFNSHNSQYIKEAIDELASLKIEWNLLKDRVPTTISFLNLRVLHGAPTFYQDSTLNFSFHKVLLDLITNPPIYGTIDLEVQAEFESKYGQSLYENSTRFVNLHKSNVIALDTFRKLLGVQEDKYTSMRELTRNVIAPAMEEVNERSDFVVSLAPQRMGRKTTGFELAVTAKKKTAATPPPTCQQDKQHICEELQRTFGVINTSVLETILQHYSEAYILEKIAYTKQHVKKTASFYPIAYFISALKGDYKLPSSEQPSITVDMPLNEVQQWRGKLQNLQHDLQHWQAMLNYAQAEDAVQIERLHDIIRACEEKLRHHYSQQPAEQEMT
jgi:hypothetical protein